MALCAYCKTAESELYEYGEPVCLKCADIRPEDNKVSSTEYGEPPSVGLALSRPE